MNQKKKTFLKRITAVLLVMTLMCPTTPVLAADADEQFATEDTIENESQIQPDAVVPEISQEQEISNDPVESEFTEETEDISGTVVDETEVGTVEDTAVDDGMTALESEAIEQRMNWTYVESSYLETPGTQRIVVSWGDGTEGIENMTMKVQSSQGTLEEWSVSKSVDTLYLFEKEYTDESQNGTYEAIELTVRARGLEKTFTMDEMGAEVLFGVNEKYEGIEELQPIEVETADSEVSTSVATINDDGTLEAEESIGAALAQASAEVQASIPSTMSVENSAMPVSETRAGNIVVALDPGHDVLDAGAYGNGLSETELTLKIANYCKEELEQYAGVTVYMTRTSSACPVGITGSSHAGRCIEERVRRAAAAGAKIFVSFHLNAFNGSAYGAEVIVPNNNWKPDVGAAGTALGASILNELVSLGLYRRNIYSKDTTVNERYEDGSISDYFSVQIYCKEEGIPGIIVEHAFIDNASDANRFLKTESGLKSLGVADATGIAKYLGLQKLGTRVNVQEGTYTLDSALAPGKGIRVNDNSFVSGAGTVLSTKKGNTSSQRFEIVSVGEGYYNIIAEHSGKALEVIGDGKAGYTYIEQRERNSDSEAQKWCFVDAGDGEYYIKSASNTCVDVRDGLTEEGTTVWTYTCNQTDAQKWKLIKEDRKTIEEGVYEVCNSTNEKQVITVFDESTNNFANVEIDSQKEISSQHFEVSYAGNGYYKIIAEHSGKSLDILNGSEKSGANLQQYEWNNTDAQLWKFIDAGNGAYYIRSKKGTTISVETSDATSNANVCMDQVNGDNVQKWVMKEVEGRPVQDGTYVIENAKSSEKVISINGQNVELGSYMGTKNQVFDVKYIGDGYYQIISVSSGKSLDVANASAAPGANLWEYSWNGSDAQLWKFIVNSDGTYYIKSKLGTVIDIFSGIFADGTNIQMYTANGSDAQKWKLDSAKEIVNERPLENGTYIISNATNSKQVLDITSALETDGANVQTYAFNNTSAQHFELFYVGNGYYKILVEKSGKALDVAGASAQTGANVWQYSWNNSDAQLWRVIDAGDGYYYLQSKLGTFLSLNGLTASSGMNVQTEHLKGKENQKWKFETSSYQPVKNGKYTLRSSKDAGYTVDISNASKADGANAWLYYYNGSKPQQFNISYVGKGYYKIIAEHSGKALTVVNDSGKAGVNVEQKKWVEGSDTQLWKFVSTNEGYYIRSKTGTVLDISSAVYAPYTNIWTYSANGSSAQKWNLEKEYVSAEIEEGIYTIRTGLHPSRVLDIANGSAENGGNTWIYAENNTDAQRFEIEEISDGYYKIESKISGKVLDVANGSRMAGANVWQYSWNGSDAQLWRFIDAGSGKYYIQSKLGTVLDVTSASTTLGTNVQTYTLNQTNAQKWILLKPEGELYHIMGESNVTTAQMVKFYEDKKSVDYPYSNVSEAPTIERFCQIYKEECEAEGVRVEVAFAQAMLETGFLKFGGDVKKDQYNFAGIGAIGGGAAGAKFDSIRIGIRAQVQHLKAYASTDDLKNQIVDPRFQYVKRGCAEYVQWLGQKENPNGYGWATSPNYGNNIVNLYILPMKRY